MLYSSDPSQTPDLLTKIQEVAPTHPSLLLLSIYFSVFFLIVTQERRPAPLGRFSSDGVISSVLLANSFGFRQRKSEGKCMSFYTWQEGV